MQTLTKDPTLAPSIPAAKISKIRSAKSGVIIEAKFKIGPRNTEFSHNFYNLSHIFGDFRRSERARRGFHHRDTENTKLRGAGSSGFLIGKTGQIHRVHRVLRARLSYSSLTGKSDPLESWFRNPKHQWLVVSALWLVKASRTRTQPQPAQRTGNCERL